jgi:hypothetical protein
MITDNGNTGQSGPTQAQGANKPAWRNDRNGGSNWRDRRQSNQ